MKRIHFETDSFMKAVFGGVFLILLHGLMHLVCVYLVVFIGDESFILGESYELLSKALFQLSLLSCGWVAVQTFFVVWRRSFDALSLILTLMFGLSIATIIYTWCFRIIIVHAYF